MRKPKSPSTAFTGAEAVGWDYLVRVRSSRIASAATVDFGEIASGMSLVDIDTGLRLTCHMDSGKVTPSKTTCSTSGFASDRWGTITGTYTCRSSGNDSRVIVKLRGALNTRSHEGNVVMGAITDISASLRASGTARGAAISGFTMYSYRKDGRIWLHGSPKSAHLKVTRATDGATPGLFAGDRMYINAMYTINPSDIRART